MIIFTDSLSVKEPLEVVVEKCIKKYSPQAIFLREKHLTDQEYLAVYKKIMLVCNRHSTPLFLCHRLSLAKTLDAKFVHLNLQELKNINSGDFCWVSCSIHSDSEAQVAQSLGAKSLVFGHIFETDCKKGLQPRGVKQLSSICKKVDLPVVAIGGINAQNCKSIAENGASDFAIMSSAMQLKF